MRKDLQSVFNYIVQFKGTCECLRIHEVAAIWLFTFFMFGAVLATVKMRLTFKLMRSRSIEELLRFTVSSEIM